MTGRGMRCRLYGTSRWRASTCTTTSSVSKRLVGGKNVLDEPITRRLSPADGARIHDVTPGRMDGVMDGVFLDAWGMDGVFERWTVS